MKKILFICVHNSGRSQMAEAFLNSMAAGKAVAVSAGTQPGDKVDPTVAAVMKEIGIDISGYKPKALTVEMMDGADKAITMGCGVEENACPAALIETEDWGLDDPKGQPVEKVREIRDEIKRRVTALIAKL